MNSILRKLSLLSCIGMLLVLLMGTLVTKTDSGRGCGEDWPLCNGKFVPAYTIQSMIEYSHRFVTGLEGLLVVAAFVAVWRYSKKTDARVYASSALFFTVLQAIMGAMAVMWPQASAVLALHFGLSLLAFTSTVLQVLALRGNKEAPARGGQSRASSRQAAMQRSPGPSGRSAESAAAALPPGLRGLIWLAAVYCYVVVYLGAYVKHTNSGGGCSGWPLCNGQVVPEMSGASGVVFVHRVAALLLFILIAFLYRAIRKSAAGAGGSTLPLVGAARFSLYFVVAQVISGALVTFAMATDWYLPAGFLHTLLVSGLFTALCYLCALTVGRQSAVSPVLSPKSNA